MRGSAGSREARRPRCRGSSKAAISREPATLSPRAAMRLTALVALVIGISGCSRTGPTDGPSPHLIERAHPSMGAQAQFSAWAGDDAATLHAFAEGFAELERLEALM